MGPTQPPTECVLRSHSPGVKQPGNEVDHSSPSNVKLRMSAAILYSPLHALMVCMGKTSFLNFIVVIAFILLSLVKCLTRKLLHFDVTIHHFVITLGAEVCMLYCTSLMQGPHLSPCTVHICDTRTKGYCCDTFTLIVVALVQ